MAAGRNDPGDRLYERLRRCEGSVVDRLTRFARRRRGETALAEAAEEFNLGLLEAGEEPDVQAFVPWFVFDWVPEPRKPGAPSLADAYLLSEAASLSDDERAFIEAVRREPFSFYEVIESNPGLGLRVRDILREVESQVIERTASGTLQKGDVLYGRVASLSGISMFEGIGSVALPPSWKTELVRLRRDLREKAGTITTQALREASVDLRRMYLEMRRRARDRSLPVLQNTDGDPIVFHTLVFRVPSAWEAFEALKSLARGGTDEDLLHGAAHDSEGRLHKIDLPWLKRGNKVHATWENTVLGRLLVEGDRLTVEVNSAKRARRIQAEIRKRLGDGAALLKTETRSVEAAMAEAKQEDKTPEGRKRRREAEAFQRRPAIQDLVQKQTDAHWKAWVQTKVPALGNKTPAEAVADPGGREMVEALLTEFERSDSKRPPGQPRLDTAGLRRRLGLTPGP